ncbi:MAG TPA: SDR family NAD(P)-dependent oxidoreductase [Vineibacter sp.]|nr:SDR family NAD(P)-dependent oxidoreductase [Vineibacter sp.]
MSEPRFAVVTGAANGIGRATALRFADDGCDLAIVDIEAQPLAEVAAAIEAKGRQCRKLLVDCRDPAAIEAAARDIEAMRPVDILFNNVGQSGRERATEFWTSDPEVWRFVLEISLLSTMRWSRQIVPGMRQRRSGRIINMSTESAFYGDVGLVDYAAAKMGVVGFTRSLARELAPFHVTVNVVGPGAIRTRAHDRLPKETIDKVRNSVPMGFVGAPEDVAHVVSFLASDGARYVTGQTILIDGGRWMI